MLGMLCYVRYNFPKGFFPSGNFLYWYFPKCQLPNCAIFQVATFNCAIFQVATFNCAISQVATLTVQLTKWQLSTVQFPKWQLSTMQFPKWQLPNCTISQLATSQLYNFPTGNFPTVQFPRTVTSQDCPSRSARTPPHHCSLLHLRRRSCLT